MRLKIFRRVVKYRVRRFGTNDYIEGECDGNKRNLKDQEMQGDQLTAILSEYNMLREEMRLFLESHRKDTQIFIGGMGILISIYLTNSPLFDVQILTLLIPSAIFLFYLLQVFNLHMVSAEAKACARIEEKINRTLNGDWMVWESKVARRFVRGSGSPTSLGAWAILFFFICLFIGFALKAGETYGQTSFFVHTIELIVMLVSTYQWVYFETKVRLPD